MCIDVSIRQEGCVSVDGELLLAPAARVSQPAPCVRNACMKWSHPVAMVESNIVNTCIIWKMDQGHTLSVIIRTTAMYSCAQWLAVRTHGKIIQSTFVQFVCLTLYV